MLDENITIDLRSDTVTKPSPEMWQALKSMNDEDLGDDVECEDPTVINLEQLSAEILGKEAALFVTSGTQGNLLALLSHTNPGDEIILEEHSHIYKWEVGGAARIGGLMVRTFPSNKGLFDPNDLISLLRDGNDIHEPRTRLLALENTHNFHGGIILPVSLFEKSARFAKEHNLRVHLDGARLWNATNKLQCDIKDFTQYVDSVQVCLSKGLACPIGSILAGSQDFIAKARKFRKMLGGGWRQAGIVAKFGLVALQENWLNRISEDHILATLLANNIRDDDLGIAVPEPDTNLVMVHLPKSIDPFKFETALHDKGLLAHVMGGRIRLVTHYGIKENLITRSAEIIKNLVKNWN